MKKKENKMMQGKMLKTINCQDCDYVSDNEILPSNGKCSACHATGLISDVLDAFLKSVVRDG